MNNIFVKLNNSKYKRGYVALSSVLLFAGITAIIVLGLARPVLASHAAAKAFTASTHAFLVGNSAAEDALYRLKNGMQLASSETLSFPNATAGIVVSDTFNSKQVSVSADSGDFNRALEVEVNQGSGVSFHYGIQAGIGGFVMSGGAGIYGNAYSNGDIIGSGGPFITGSATVANGADPTVDQHNGDVFPPAQQLDFGGNTTQQDAAQSFTAGTAEEVTSIRIYIKKSTTGWMNNITVRLTEDNGGKPAKQTLATAGINAGAVTTSFNYLTLPLSSVAELTPGETYWLVFDTGTTWGAYYSLAAASNSYAGGVGQDGSWSNGNGGTWGATSPSGLDIYFDTYTGGDTGLITGITIGSGSTGDAWAHEVNNSNVSGTIYCQAASGNNKACDTSRPDPVQQPYPVSDGNIADWKSQATAGGVTNGSLSYGGDDEDTLGPQKIVGNLSVGSGAILEITGIVYVTGNVSVSGGGIIRLGSSYGENSGVIVADGRISITGGGQVEGSGTSGSYLMMVTTSTCPTDCGGQPAIHASGGTGAVILNAQEGTIQFSGGAQAKQATGKTIEMSGGTTIHYETGIADMTFSSGPSGGWSLLDWQEL